MRKILRTKRALREEFTLVHGHHGLPVLREFNNLKTCGALAGGLHRARCVCKAPSAPMQASRSPLREGAGEAPEAGS